MSWEAINNNEYKDINRNHDKIIAQIKILISENVLEERDRFATIWTTGKGEAIMLDIRHSGYVYQTYKTYLKWFLYLLGLLIAGIGVYNQVCPTNAGSHQTDVNKTEVTTLSNDQSNIKVVDTLGMDFVQNSRNTIQIEKPDTSKVE